jgi:hypothetical protein
MKAKIQKNLLINRAIANKMRRNTLILFEAERSVYCAWHIRIGFTAWKLYQASDAERIAMLDSDPREQKNVHSRRAKKHAVS